MSFMSEVAPPQPISLQVQPIDRASRTHSEKMCMAEQQRRNCRNPNNGSSCEPVKAATTQSKLLPFKKVTHGISSTPPSSPSAYSRKMAATRRNSPGTCRKGQAVRKDVPASVRRNVSNGFSGKKRQRNESSLLRPTFVVLISATTISLLFSCVTFLMPTLSTKEHFRRRISSQGHRFVSETRTQKQETSAHSFPMNTSISLAGDGQELEMINRSSTMNHQSSPASLKEARNRGVQPLRPIDYEQYTIRLNTFRRNELLLVSLNHHSRCDGVAQIQVIWCDPDNEPPPEIANHTSGKVVIEKHGVNSLNERFRVLIPTPTLGILSIDDDLLRPCEAIDAGFFRWIRSPDRMVGYDGRVHFEENGMWKYGSYSKTKQKDAYSMTLTRYSFLHRDYLDFYTYALPHDIQSYVEDHLNCEDIAMSFLVSSLTDGLPPLLARDWAIRTQIKLFHMNAISMSIAGHTSTRDECVDSFARQLGLKRNGEEEGITENVMGEVVHELQMESLKGGDGGGGFSNLHQAEFERRDKEVERVLSEREQVWVKKLLEWQRGQTIRKRMKEIMAKTGHEAKSLGLVDKTEEWTKRWGDHDKVDEENRRKKQNRQLQR